MTLSGKELSCSPSASDEASSRKRNRAVHPVAVVGTIDALNFDRSDATLVTFRVPISSAWGVGQYLISRAPALQHSDQPAPELSFPDEPKAKEGTYSSPSEVMDLVERAAQTLFDRTCERAAARGHQPHHKPGTLVRSMPPSYKDDYYADAQAMLDTVGIASLLSRVESLTRALEPFAKIKPSSLYPADGSENEEYIVMLKDDYGNPAEITGRDLARARSALTSLNKRGEDEGASTQAAPSLGKDQSTSQQAAMSKGE